MGIGDVISWSIDSVKGLWRSSYDHGSAAVTKMNQHLSDPETRSEISRVATNVAKKTAIEGLKTIPGAFPTYKIVTESLSDDDKPKNGNKSKEKEEDLETLKATVSRLEKDVGVLREQAAIQNKAKSIQNKAVQAYQKPKDTIRVSKMKDFICSHL